MLKGKNIFLRALEPSDIEPLYQWENDPLVWKVSNTYAPWSRHVLEEYILSSHQDIYVSKQVRMVICETKTTKPVGCIDLFEFDPNNLRAGIGIIVNSADRKSGFADDALGVMINYCFSTLNLHQVFCNISSSNEGSIRLFEKHGFIKCGVKKEWNRISNGFEDEFLYQLLSLRKFV